MLARHESARWLLASFPYYCVPHDRGTRRESIQEGRKGRRRARVSNRDDRGARQGRLKVRWLGRQQTAKARQQKPEGAPGERQQPTGAKCDLGRTVAPHFFWEFFWHDTPAGRRAISLPPVFSLSRHHRALHKHTGSFAALPRAPTSAEPTSRSRLQYYRPTPPRPPALALAGHPRQYAREHSAHEHNAALTRLAAPPDPLRQPLLPHPWQAELAKVVDRTTGLAQHNLSRSAATLVAPGMRHLRESAVTFL